MPGQTDRRTFLRGGAALFGGGSALWLAGCSDGGSSTGANTGAGAAADGGEDITVRVAWWGGEVRHAKFNEIYDLYEEENPNVTIAREAAEWTAYWERLPTQFAGGNAPDIVHMVERTVSEFAGEGREQLMDLQPLIDQGLIDVQYFPENVLEGGMVNGKLVMLLIGGTIPATMYNQGLFDQAGIAVPPADWEWELFHQTAVDLTQALPDGTYGATDSSTSAALFETYLLQEGKSLFAADGSPELAFEVADTARWFQLWQELRDAGGIPPAGLTAENSGAPFEDQFFARGTTAMNVQNHNQLVTFQEAVGDSELHILPFPQAGERPAAMVLGSYVSMNADTSHPEESASVIDFFLNDPDANLVYGMEIGVPANTNWQEAIRGSLSPAEQRVLEFTESVQDISFIAPVRPVGGGLIETLLVELGQAVSFGELTPEQAGQQLESELSASIERG